MVCRNQGKVLLGKTFFIYREPVSYSVYAVLVIKLETNVLMPKVFLQLRSDRIFWVRNFLKQFLQGEVKVSPKMLGLGILTTNKKKHLRQKTTILKISYERGGGQKVQEIIIFLNILEINIIRVIIY